MTTSGDEGGIVSPNLSAGSADLTQLLSLGYSRVLLWWVGCTAI